MSEIKKSLIKYSAIIIVSVVLFGLAYGWLGGSLEVKSKEIAQNRIIISEHNAILQTIADLKKISPQVADYQSKMDSLLPDKDDIIGFSKKISDLSQIHSVKSDFSFGGKAVDAIRGLPGYFPFSLSVAGSYDNLKAFFDELEGHTGNYWISLDNVSFSSNSAGSYNVNASGKAYFQNE